MASVCRVPGGMDESRSQTPSQTLFAHEMQKSSSSMNIKFNRGELTCFIEHSGPALYLVLLLSLAQRVNTCELSRYPSDDSD